MRADRPSPGVGAVTPARAALASSAGSSHQHCRALPGGQSSRNARPAVLQCPWPHPLPGLLNHLQSRAWPRMQPQESVASARPDRSAGRRPVHGCCAPPRCCRGAYPLPVAPSICAYLLCCGDAWHFKPQHTPVLPTPHDHSPCHMQLPCMYVPARRRAGVARSLAIRSPPDWPTCMSALAPHCTPRLTDGGQKCRHRTLHAVQASACSHISLSRTSLTVWWRRRS